MFGRCRILLCRNESTKRQSGGRIVLGDDRRQRGHAVAGQVSVRWSLDISCTTLYTHEHTHTQTHTYIPIYTGRFIMFSMITNIYNKKTKGPTVMELFTATGKLKKLLFFLKTRDVRCVHHGCAFRHGSLQQ
jgi:hypothetical protein